MDKKLQKSYPIDYNLSEVQDLRQVHYKILLIILLKEFKKLISGNIDVIIKKCETYRIEYKDCKFYVFILNIQALKIT